MSKRIKVGLAAVILSLAMFALGGIAQAAFVWIDVYPGDSGYIVCDEPGTFESLGFVPAWRDTDGGPEWVGWYWECQTGKVLADAGKADVGDLIQPAPRTTD